MKVFGRKPTANTATGKYYALRISNYQKIAF